MPNLRIAEQQVDESQQPLVDVRSGLLGCTINSLQRNYISAFESWLYFNPARRSPSR
jgi:hypothetical protein